MKAESKAENSQESKEIRVRKLAIIPARGGSKRILQKNIRVFVDKPIIAYSIKAAQDSELFDEIMVSTDDEQISNVAREYGATVPFMRSAATSGDFATTAQVLEEVLNEYSKMGHYFSYACCLYATAPFITGLTLQKGLAKLQEEGCDSLFPVQRFNYPIWRGLRLEDGKVEMYWPEHLNSRSQDLPVAYHDAGQFYFFRVDKFLEKKALFTDNSGAIEVSELLVQDIDSETDWKLAELKYKMIHNIE
jgi:pseudaminic acid cytidylyltransferase